MVKGIILDMDGLISDTERLHMKSYQNAFKEIDVEITDEKYSEHWIQKGLGVIDVINEFKLDVEVDQMRAFKRKYYDYYLETDLLPMPYAIEFVKHFYGKIPMAVASASLGRDVKCVLEKFEILDYVEFFLAYEDVNKRKPDPEIWVKAAERLNLKPEECIALEDAEKGIIAAHRANMPVIAIPNEYTMNNDFSKATWRVDSLREAKELIEKLNGK